MYEKLRSRLDRKDDSGFTLIELLMVIVILAVLAAVVVFSVGGITDTGKASACKATVNSINTAAEAYYAKNQAAATDLDAIVTAGFLHQNTAEISGTKFQAPSLTATGSSIQYTITYSPTVGTAGGVSAVTNGPASCTA